MVAFVFIFTSVYAQCDEGAVKRNAKKSLNPYQLEALITRPLQEFPGDKGTIEAEFFAYEQEDYKFVNLSTGFSDDVHFDIYDPAKKLVYSSTKGSDNEAYSFIANTSGSYLIKFIVADSDKEADGCISFAIGYAL